MALIYLDHNATTPVDERVLAAMLPYFREAYGNAASRQHALGRAAAGAVEDARGRAAGLIGADPREIVWTSGSTESNNLAIKGAARFQAEQGRGRHIVTSSIEHKSVLGAYERLESEGFDVTYIDPTPGGTVPAERIAAALRDDTSLVSIMWANNEIGTINPIAEIGAACRERGVIFHCDATQAVGKVPVDVDAACVDLLCFSAHKMYGPKGVGALYVRRRRPRVRLMPLIDGGGHERGVRAGTLNVPGIVGFGAACDLCAAEMEADAARLGDLRDRLEAGLMNRLDGVQVNGDRDRRLPHTTNLSFAGLDAERLMRAAPDLAVSSGAACTTASIQSSYVLRRLGLPAERARSSIRFGLGRATTAAEIDRAVDCLVHAARNLERLAPACDVR